MNKRGEPCQVTVGVVGGWCPTHANGGRDMRQLGRLGGKRSRRMGGEASSSVREELSRIDPKLVRAGIERALAGGNESARVSAIRLLHDVEAFKRGDCPECAAREREAEQLSPKNFHAHRLEQSKEVYAELVDIGVLARAPHPELETPRRA